ncbi:unnamed protein product, partial [Ranitomeya imitator]
ITYLSDQNSLWNESAGRQIRRAHCTCARHFGRWRRPGKKTDGPREARIYFMRKNMFQTFDEGFVITDSNMMTHADSSDEEMKTMLAELHRKFGGDCESEECFPSNPLCINNQNYIEFNDDTDENRSGKNDWCHCGNCVPMPTNIESICCQEIQKMRNHICWILVVETVHIVLRTVDQNLHPPPSKEMKRKLRKTAYRSFTAWIHGYLGAGNRRPIPACVVNKVRFAFPDDDHEYMGFKPSNDYANLCCRIYGFRTGAQSKPEPQHEAKKRTSSDEEVRRLTRTNSRNAPGDLNVTSFNIRYYFITHISFTSQHLMEDYG